MLVGTESPPLPVVLISGWGQPVAWIRPVLPDGIGPVTAWSLSAFRAGSPGDWLEQALEQAPEKAVWVGWSLGGQLAMAAAEKAPERVAGVVTLCTTPCFVASDDWPYGRPEEDFAAFAQRCDRQPEATLRRFALLQSRGDAHEDRARREGPASLAARKGVEEVTADVAVTAQKLSDTLQWLRTTDQRPLWRQTLPQPRLHLFGERDPLVDPETPRALGLAQDQWHCLPGLAHWPFGPHLPALQALLQGTFQRWSRVHD